MKSLKPDFHSSSDSQAPQLSPLTCKEGVLAICDAGDCFPDNGQSKKNQTKEDEDEVSEGFVWCVGCLHLSSFHHQETKTQGSKEGRKEGDEASKCKKQQQRRKRQTDQTKQDFEQST